MSAFYRLEERERGREGVSEGEEKTRKIHTERGGSERENTVRLQADHLTCFSQSASPLSLRLLRVRSVGDILL